MNQNENINIPSNYWVGPVAVGVYFAVIKLVLHFVFNSNYGYFRDELYFLACGEHLAFGYPDHAPMVALMAKASRVLFGDSLFAIRFFPAVAGAAKVFLTGLLVKEFGGKTFAAALACLCVLCAPMYLGIDNLLSMNSLEPVFWMLCVYFIVRAVKSNGAPTTDGEDSEHSPFTIHHSPLFLLLFGLFAGLGLMNKHSMLFFGFALIAGLLLTRERKVFLDKYFWLAGALALIVFLPNIIWQFQNNFATLELLQNVQKSGKNVVLSPPAFLMTQILGLLPASIFVWLPGIWFFLADKNGRRFRFLGIAYLVLFALMIYLKAKDYYLIPVYPMLFAAGGVFWEQLIEKVRGLRFLKVVLPVLILGMAIIILPMALPVLPVETLIKYQEAIGFKPPKSEVAHDGILQQFYGDQFGWQEMVEKVSEVYNALPPEERAKTAIYGSNYGEAGAIDFFGAQYNLPKAISAHQSYYVWGPREYTGEIVILLGSSFEDAEKGCQTVEQKTEINNPYTMPEEKYHILVCRQTKKPLPEIWPVLKHWN